MAPFPLLLTELLGHYGAYLVYLLIGFGFGFVLEMSGFGKSTKLAAQFYFKEQTVLKVMFTGIIVAMVLIFGASALGLLDYNLIWVNPTYLWPGIVGGLIMGVGFIIGGFCPGTSLVAAATLKIDGIFFVLGVFTGIFFFGESVGSFTKFWNSSSMGRFTLPELFGASTGVVVLGVVFMALFMFWGAEQLERIFGGLDPRQAPKARFVGAGVLVALSVAVLLIGQPTVEDRWERISAEKEARLQNREVQIHPGELLDLMHNDQLKLIILDMRSEVDYNLFHIVDSRRVALADMEQLAHTLIAEPANTVTVLVSNDEAHSTEAWKVLMAQSVPNVYILEGGINCWLDIFGYQEHIGCYTEAVPGNDTLRHIFTAAVGANQPAAEPDPHNIELEYTPKIKLEMKKAPSGGGCG
jgi:hypothetical protein